MTVDHPSINVNRIALASVHLIRLLPLTSTCQARAAAVLSSRDIISFEAL